MAENEQAVPVGWPIGFRGRRARPILSTSPDRSGTTGVTVRRSKCRSPITSSVCLSRWSVRCTPRIQSSPRPCAAQTDGQGPLGGLLLVARA